MGYAEAYAPLAVALLVFLTLLLLHTRHEEPLWKVGAAWAVALFLRLNALFLGPLLAAARDLAPSTNGFRRAPPGGAFCLPSGRLPLPPGSTR